MRAVCLAAGLLLATALASPAQDMQRSIRMVSEEKSVHSYPSVSAVLADLKKRKDLDIQEVNGWTMIQNQQNRHMWTFSGSGQAAHPVVVHRIVTMQNGKISIGLETKCESPNKPACDRLTAQFRKFNERLAADLKKTAAKRAGKWRPADGYQARANEFLDRFLTTLGRRDFASTYAFFGPRLKSMMSVVRFTKLRQSVVERAGGAIVRGNRTITWYKDPARAPEPGIYAAFDINCTSPKQAYCSEVVVLHEPPGGDFTIVRHETNFVDPAVLQKLIQQKRLKENRRTP